MDLKFKGNWVGNIYQKFEAICQDVDDFVSKDRVKHVQNAGETVKKFYSGDVGDILPPLVNLIKHATQVVPLKQIDSTGICAKGVQENSVAINIKPSSADMGSFQDLSPEHKNMSEEVLHSEPNAEKYSSGPEVNVSLATIVDDQKSISSEKVEMLWNWSWDDDDSVCETAHGGVGANMDSNISVDDKKAVLERSLKEDLSSLNYKNLAKSSLFGDIVDENNSTIILSEVLLDGKPVAEKTSNGTEAGVSVATVVDDQEIWNWSWSTDCDDSVYETAYTGESGNADSDIAVHDKNVMEERSLRDDLSSPKHKNLAEAPLCNDPIDEKNSNGTLTKVSVSTLVDDLEFRSSQEEEALCESCFDGVEYETSSALRNSELEFSVVYCENKVEETAHVSSQSFVNSSKEADILCCDSTDATTCFFEFHGDHNISESFPDQASDNKYASAFSSSTLLVESADADAKFDEELCVAGSSGIKHEQYCRYVPFKAILYSSETGVEDNSIIDVADPSLETIDLSDKVTLDKSCFIVEDNPAYAFSCVARKHRSYKKIVQDAFASRKRLIKEYKQLGIRYGDIDIVSSLRPEQDSLPSNTSSEFKKSAAADLCDADWELL